MLSQSRNGYCFKAARERIQVLTALYRQGRRNPDDTDWGWDLIAQIEELEKEIAEAHLPINRKTTTLHGGHSVMQFENIIAPIIPQWNESINGGNLL